MTIKKLSIPLLGQPDPNVPSDVHLVGRYAIGVTWADQHGSIYPFEKLRRDCACGACAGVDELAQGAAWPEEINRSPAGLAVQWADRHQSLYPYRDLRDACRCAACTGGH